MPLKLTVVVSRKVGLPGFSSRGASCGIELELAESLVFADPAAFLRQARDAYRARSQAVDDELARHQALPVHPRADAAAAGGNGQVHHPTSEGRNGTTPNQSGGANPRARRPATPRQVRAIRALARRGHADLEQQLLADSGVARFEDLSLSQASEVISRFQATAGA